MESTFKHNNLWFWINFFYKNVSLFAKKRTFSVTFGVQKRDHLDTGYQWRTVHCDISLFAKFCDSIWIEKNAKKVLKLVTIGPNEKSLPIVQEKHAKKCTFLAKSGNVGDLLSNQVG